MKRELEQFLAKWPSQVISDTDIFCFFETASHKGRKDVIQRAISWGWLQRVKRGLYLVGPPFCSEKPSLFELAQHIYGPSYISMESALSFHGMIPEAVYATVSACAKRSCEYETSLGLFLFHHMPVPYFYEGVEKVQNNQGFFLMASPLKALGDYVYSKKKSYLSMTDLQKDLRLDVEVLKAQSLGLLKSLVSHYPSQRVKEFYQLIHNELFS